MPRKICRFVSTNAAYKFTELASAAWLFADDAWNDVVAQNVPCRFPRFVAVKRALGRGDFTEAGMRSVRNLNEHDMAFLRRAKARFERMQQPHAQLAHFNLFDKHAMPPG